MSLPPDPPVAAPDIRSVRAALDRFGFNAEALVDLFGPERLPLAGTAEMAHFLRLTRSERPVDLLARLFLLGAAVDAGRARAVLGAVNCAAFESSGLLRSEEGLTVGTCRLQPFRGLIIACDPAAAQHREQVMGITESTLTLADSGVREKAGSVLDLGAGSGFVALSAAAYSQPVAASDLSSRAVAFARFNAALNGIPGIEFFEGDGFAPVAGRRFDLILCNPPFAVTPGIRFTFRDGGLPGDEFCRRLIRAAPEHLNEGGFFQMMCNWIQTGGQDWKERVASWLEGTGCDAWVLRIHTDGGSAYAAKWIRDTEFGTDSDKRNLYEEWAQYYEAAGIEAITTGLVFMRRRSGFNFLEMEDAPEMAGGFGDEVRSWFAARDYLGRTGDREFLSARLALHPHLRLDQEMQAAAGAWKVASARLRIARGLCWTGTVDGHAAALLARCDGSRSAGEAIAAFAEAFGATVERVAPSAVPLLRQMLARGYLILAGS